MSKTVSVKEIELGIWSFVQEKLGDTYKNFVMEDFRFFREPLVLTAREMVYLFHYAESHYHVKFVQEDIDSMNFYSLFGFSEIIASKLLL